MMLIRRLFATAIPRQNIQRRLSYRKPSVLLCGASLSAPLELKRESSSKSELKQRLTPAEYKVCRMKGTEPAFSGELYYNKEKGLYLCKCCNTQLFKSDTKYDSGSGWPSFYDALPGALKLHEDASHGMTRTEVTCAKCACHLGHVFDDGPKPTSKRYCINSLSLDFKKDEVKK